MTQIERDAAARQLDPGEAEQAKIEAARRLLRAQTASGATTRSSRKAAVVSALAAIAAIPLFSLYVFAPGSSRSARYAAGGKAEERPQDCRHRFRRGQDRAASGRTSRGRSRLRGRGALLSAKRPRRGGGSRLFRGATAAWRDRRPPCNAWRGPACGEGDRRGARRSRSGVGARPNASESAFIWGLSRRKRAPTTRPSRSGRSCSPTRRRTPPMHSLCGVNSTFCAAKRRPPGPGRTANRARPSRLCLMTNGARPSARWLSGWPSGCARAAATSKDG